MVQAVINIDESANRILNIVKAKYGLKDKSEAINIVVGEYGENFLEPELRPEYKKEIMEIVKGKHLSRKEIDKSLVKPLKEAREYPRQTYNELIKHMLKVFQTAKKSNQYDEFLHKIQQAKMKELWDNAEDEAWERA